jgi:hypothetical protein
LGEKLQRVQRKSKQQIGFIFRQQTRFIMIRVFSKSLQSLALQRAVLKNRAVIREFCDKIEKNETEIKEDVKLSGFAKAFEKHATPAGQVIAENKLPDLSFATLLRNSKLTDVSMRTKFRSRKILLAYRCIEPISAWRSSQQNCCRKDFPCGRRRPLHRLRLEVPLCVHSTKQKFCVSW